MKKFINGIVHIGCIPKLSLKMKLTSLLLIVSLFQMFANDVSSQNKKVTLELDQVTIESVLNEIEQKTNYKFLYENNVFQEDKIVSVSVKNKKLSSVLESIFKDSNVDFIFFFFYINKNKIIIPNYSKQENVIIKEPLKQS